MKRKILRYIGAGLCAVLVLAGCAGKPKDDAPPDTSQPTDVREQPAQQAGQSAAPDFGGEMAISMRLPKTLNPILNADQTVDTALSLLFEPLVVLDAARKPVANAAIVSRLAFAPDGMSADVTIKSDAAWSDGTPMTAADVRFTIDAMRGAEDGLYHGRAANVASCEANGQTARLTFTQPFGGALYQLRFPIIPEHYYKNKKADDPAQMKPLGDGLYVFESFNATDGMTLAASENACGGKPYVAVVKALIARDEAADVNMFDSRLTDALTAFVADGGKYKGAADFRAVTYTTNYFDFIALNNEKLDMAARRAIAAAVPLERVARTAYIGGVAPAPAPIPPDSWLYEPAAVLPRYDTEAAKQAPTPARAALTLLTNAENPERGRAAAQIKESMAEAGVTVTVETLDYAAYAARIAAGEYDMALAGYNLSAAPTFDFLFHSDGNILRCADPAMDLLLANVFTAADEQALKAAESDLQKYVADSVPLIGIGFRETAFVVSGRVEGALNPQPEQLLGGFGGWYVGK